ncbi:MAG: hypothetical protein ACFFBD_03425 [Candidatus Hodarchaeota archaeon]
MEEVCDKCYYGTTCEKPCRPVELYLAGGNLSVWTKKSIDKNGREIEIIYSRSRERQQSTLSEGVDNRGDPRLSEREQLAFSTENESPFAHFKPVLLQTGIFIDRFFHKMTYSDLATKYDLSETDCIKRYSYATKRLLEVLKIMDSKVEKDKNNKYLKQVQERSGSLPKGQKWYLLNKLFGLLPSEIAELEGLDKRSSSVRQLIIRVSDQLAAGEIKLIEVTPEESAAAKARLDEVRRKRRERHSKKEAHVR